MKAHIGVDAESGLINSVVGTAANRTVRYDCAKTRFRGLAKNAAQLVTLFALSNL
jgi:IS5 family transposase